ncbi:Precorrin-3B methylase [Haloferula sp.]|uniref:Precorrin-3B methylase n=1 Tax=Haloferula sp. TaxID=2497595 RepID=UPI00329C54FB
MATKKHKKRLLVGKGKIKEVNRRIRLARTKWDAHENKACRRERERALELYEMLDAREREQVPQVLRVWLRYRSEKYFGDGRRGNGAHSKG